MKRQAGHIQKRAQIFFQGKNRVNTGTNSAAKITTTTMTIID